MVSSCEVRNLTPSSTPLRVSSAVQKPSSLSVHCSQSRATSPARWLVSQSPTTSAPARGACAGAADRGSIISAASASAVSTVAAVLLLMCPPEQTVSRSCAVISGSR